MGGCCSCGGGGSSEVPESDGANKAEKTSMWKKKKSELVDYKFKDVDVSKFRNTGCSSIRKYITMLSASTNYFLFLALDIQIAYWLLNADPTLYPQAKAGGIAYAVFAAANLALTCYNIYKGITIYQSDDISDAFIQHEAYRLRTILSYDVFCFFTQLTAKRTCRDKVILYVFDTLYQLPQIICIKVPQLAIMMVNREALQVFANDENGIPTSQTSAAMKFGLLNAEIAFRMFGICILFPWVKCCMKQQSLAEYANYLIESRVNALVKTGKADVWEEAEVEEKGSGCCC